MNTDGKEVGVWGLGQSSSHLLWWSSKLNQCRSSAEATIFSPTYSPCVFSDGINLGWGLSYRELTSIDAFENLEKGWRGGLSRAP